MTLLDPRPLDLPTRRPFLGVRWPLVGIAVALAAFWAGVALAVAQLTR